MKRFFVLLGFLFAFPSTLYASDVYFEDNFVTIDNLKWTINSNGGSISTQDGLMKVSSAPSRFFPYLYANGDIFSQGEYKITFRFKFDGSLNYGAGIALSDKLLNNEITSNLSANDVIFLAWPDSQTTYSFWTTLCEVNATNCVIGTLKKVYSFSASEFQTVSISLDDGKYLFYLNDLLIKNYLSSKDIKYFWVGNPQKTNTTTTKPNIYLDYFKVEPLELEHNTVIILPGFGGSWDVGAILSNTPGNNWKVPEFVKEYDGIVNSLKNAGYKENEDLFVFAYDWRKPLDLLADDLNGFLISKNIDSKKISFVGHSMGGLVARSYLQKYENSNVEKVITVGSPHKGILDAYGMWEGMTVWDASWWQKGLHLLAAQINRNSGETELQAVRRVAPSIKDLLPTWDFLRNEETIVPISQMIWKNDYLLTKNNQLAGFMSRLVSGFSSDYQSKSGLFVTRPGREDALRGLWQDGKPIKDNQFLFALGDGYVTASSSGDLFNKKIPLEGNHGEVISKRENIVKILNELGVATESAVGSDFDNRKRLAIFKLNSPGVLKVCQALLCNSDLGIVFADEKMLMIPDYSEGDYMVEVSANGETGDYELLAGKINELAHWSESQGKLLSGTQTDTYKYNSQTNQLTMNEETNVRIINQYFPLGIDPKNVNKLRQEILEQVDMSIGLQDTFNFDYLLKKWLAIDKYISSLSPAKTFGMNHKLWGDGNNGFVRSKFISKMASYYTEQLIKIHTDLQTNYEYGSTDNFYKLDKKVQMNMLRAFLRL